MMRRTLDITDIGTVDYLFLADCGMKDYEGKTGFEKIIDVGLQGLNEIEYNALTHALLYGCYTPDEVDKMQELYRAYLPPEGADMTNFMVDKHPEMDGVYISFLFLDGSVLEVVPRVPEPMSGWCDAVDFRLYSEPESSGKPAEMIVISMSDFDNVRQIYKYFALAQEAFDIQKVENGYRPDVERLLEFAKTKAKKYKEFDIYCHTKKRTTTYQ